MTLVELIVVVAIVGVLSAVGVPTFRKMVRKAKQSEAKVQLGTIAKLERVFFAEYDAFGNHLPRMGYEESTSYLFGAGPTRTYNGTYSTGFFAQPICWAVVDPGSIRPEQASPAGQALFQKFPAYYSMDEEWISMRVNFELYDLTGCAEPFCRPGDVAVDGSTFTATSQGLLVQGKCPDSTSQDIWSIDQNATLTHHNDGT